jgi:hypothetical protein
MVKKTKKNDENVKYSRVISISIIIIGFFILLATALTWQPYDVSSLANKVSILTLSIGILYLLFGLILLKSKF